jgi:hypothetical protein
LLPIGRARAILPRAEQTSVLNTSVAHRVVRSWYPIPVVQKENKKEENKRKK